MFVLYFPTVQYVHDVAPESEYRPEGQLPVQLEEVSPLVDPYVPAGQLIHFDPEAYSPASQVVE